MCNMPANTLTEALLMLTRSGYNAKLKIARTVCSCAAAVWRSGTADRPYATCAGVQLAASVLLAAAQMHEMKGSIIHHARPALT